MLIYKATNKENNKSYIGQTIKDLNQRISEHKFRALHEKDFTNKFHNAIRKYGFEAFIWEILEQSDDWTDEILDQKETYYITLYNTVNNGYNILAGGQGSSEENRLNMAIHLGSKPFYAFNLKGELLGEFINKTDFARKYNIPVQRIVEMVQNKTLSSKGIIIIDKENYSIDLLNYRLKHCIKKIPFIAINLITNETFGPFTNIEECKRNLNLPKNCHITEVLKGMRKTSNNYKFEYIDIEENAWRANVDV